MSAHAAALASGKGHRDENFPVASRLIAPRHRAPILAFYRFARAADDIADNGGADAETKLGGIEAMRATLAADSDAEPTARALRDTLAAHALGPRHAFDLLEAFRRDVVKHRYADWDELYDYCTVSAMPVGRYVLDVHGEAEALWPASDALCAALQIINHLQDCAKDHRELGRVYIPADLLPDPADLAHDRSSPVLRHAIVTLAGRCRNLLAQSAGFSRAIRDRRLALEVAVIQRLAEDLVGRLETRDPLADRVHHRKSEAARLALGAVARRMLGR